MVQVFNPKQSVMKVRTGSCEHASSYSHIGTSLAATRSDSFYEPAGASEKSKSLLVGIMSCVCWHHPAS